MDGNKREFENFTEKHELIRGLGLPSLFAIGYADVGADIYIALGVTALYAAGGTPLVFLIGSILYTCIGLAYAELASTYPYAGGASVYAMMAINDLAGFLAGWMVMLDYVIDIALFSVAAAGYLGFIHPWLIESRIQLPMNISISMIGIVSILIIIALIAINYIGIKPSALFTSMLVALNLVVLTSVIAVSFLTSWSYSNFISNLCDIGSEFFEDEVSYTGLLNPKIENLLYGLTLAMSSFIGIESIAQAAEEAKNPRRDIPRASALSVIMVVASVLSCSVLGLGVLGWRGLAEAQFNPIAAIAEKIPVIGDYIAVLVAIVAFAVTVASTNTGVIGVSRLVFSMGKFLVLPKWFYQVHPKYRTPTRSILLFSLIAIAIVVLGSLQPNILVFISSLYNFGALLSYVIVLLSLIILRNIDRSACKPYKVPGAVKLRINGRAIELPLIGAIGVIGVLIMWLLVVIYHAAARVLGFLWIITGLIVYSIYRRKIKLKVMAKFGRELMGVKIMNNPAPNSISGSR